MAVSWAKPGTTRVDPAVPLDVSVRPVGELTLRAETLDTARAAALTADLERFRPCLDAFRAPRGHAGGTFTLSGQVRPDGSITRAQVTSWAYSPAAERCLTEAAATLRFPPTGLDFEVGIVASFAVEDPSTRRTAAEIRGTWSQGGVDVPEPAVTWMQLHAEGAGEALGVDLSRGDRALSDCLWHRSTEVPISTGGLLRVSVDASGSRSATLSEAYGDHEALAECLGRLVSGVRVEGPAEARVTVVVGPGATGLSAH